MTATTKQAITIPAMQPAEQAGDVSNPEHKRGSEHEINILWKLSYKNMLC